MKYKDYSVIYQSLEGCDSCNDLINLILQYDKSLDAGLMVGELMLKSQTKQKLALTATRLMAFSDGLTQEEIETVFVEQGLIKPEATKENNYNTSCFH